MATIKILCGYPRSGKTTWLNKNKTNEVVVSADDVRFLTYGQRYWQEGEGMMWHIRGILLKHLLNQGINIIIDETNITAKTRAQIIRQAKEKGYTVECISFSTPLWICNDRAIKSGQEDLIPVIERMYGQFETPTMEEGFDSLTFVVPE